MDLVDASLSTIPPNRHRQRRRRSWHRWRNSSIARWDATDLSVSAIGLGCMSLSGIYGAADDAASEDLIRYAIDQGVDHLDSSDMYGWGHNEEVIGRAIKGRRDRVVLATKFGQTQNPGGPNGVNGRPEYVMQACEASLKRLGVDVIDLYYQHRVDPSVPIEDTVGAMAQARAAGQGAASRACRRRRPRRSAARTRCIRSPRCRPSIRCCIGPRRRRRARRRGRWASASSPTRRWDAGF